MTNNDDSPDYYGHVNRVFLEAIRRSSKTPLTLLDVGCGNGSLGGALLDGCNVVVDGIEREQEEAAKAKARGYRAVYCLDLDRDPLQLAENENYDYILFGDVLEHLLDPERVLCELTKRLQRGGRALLSMPNIGFFTYRLSHLLGRWEYADYGIMDRTHLRFFTRRSMFALVESCGLKAEWAEGYVGLQRYPWIVREPMRWLGRRWPTLFAIQIVISALPKDGT